MCPCGVAIKKSNNAYKFFKETELRDITIIPNTEDKTLEVRSVATGEVVILHTCQGDDLAQVYAIRNLDPYARLTLIPSEEGRVLVCASYEKWNYILNCFITEHVQ